MDKGKMITKALGGVLVGGMLLSGGLALADEVSISSTDGLFTKAVSIQDLNTSGKAWDKKGYFKEERQKNLQAALDQLVKDGTITSQKAGEVKAYIDKANKETEARREQFRKLSPQERKALREKIKAEKAKDSSKGKSGKFKGLVNSNILTQEQADALKAKMKEISAQQNKQRITDGLKSLVQDGTITADQSDKILQQLERTKNDRKAFFEKTKDMTGEERRQYIKDNNIQFKNPLSQLVENGTITKDQADAVRNSIFDHRNLKSRNQ